MQEKILIVEDETDMADLLKYNLTEKGYNPVLASNGREALELIEKEMPYLILLDLMMEQLDGWAVCSGIRSHTNETIKRLPIIMLTALSESEEKIIGLRLGADDYMTKPFNMDELILRIQKQINKKGVEDRLIELL
ncbi:MAG: response regulator [Nitrospinae bacterium]|nr:response regulator [Nitrospinota bacterium]